MSKWPDPGPHPTVRVFRSAGFAGIHVILPANCQGDAMSCGHDDTSRPDLDVDFVDVPRRESLYLVVAVVGPVGQGKLFVELSVRHTQPTLRDRRVRIQRAAEHDLLQVRTKYPNHEKQIGVGRRRRNPQFRCNRSGDLGLAGQNRRKEGHAIPETVIRDF